MRKMITMAVTAALAISTLTACGKTDKKETTASTAATTASTEAKTEAKDTSAAAAESKADAQTPVSGSVATDGSTSMEKVIGALGEAFTKANPDATFTYNPTGSGSGITAVSEGRCDIGLSSRALKDEEKSQGLVETTLALDGIAIIVNKENTVEVQEMVSSLLQVHLIPASIVRSLPLQVMLLQLFQAIQVQSDMHL